MTTNLLLPVAAPPAAPPRISLLASAQVITSESGPWTDGYTFVPEGSQGGGVIAPCDGQYGEPEELPAPVEAIPFYVWESAWCSALGRTPLNTYDALTARARRNLAAAESYHVAREFWRGDLATAESWDDQPVLARLASDVVTSGAATPLAAMGCLEQALSQAQRGGRGMIHCTPQLLTYWQSLYLIRREGTLNLTAMDTIVVADAGYDGSDPYGNIPTAGHQWAYATGLVQVRLDAVTVLPGSEAEAVDRRINKTVVWANRLASPSWDRRAHIAAEVDLPLCGINGS